MVANFWIVPKRVSVSLNNLEVKIDPLSVNIVCTNPNLQNISCIIKAPYRVSREQHRIISEQVAEMFENGIIRESRSPYASPVVLVKKPDNTWRFCVDFRKLNKKVITDSYPLPIIEDIITYLNGAKYFADLDLNSGYWQLKIKESDKHKTAFITSSGLYEFNVLPFGLKTSGAIFQRTMDKVLAGLKYTCAIVN